MEATGRKLKTYYEPEQAYLKKIQIKLLETKKCSH